MRGRKVKVVKVVKVEERKRVETHANIHPSRPVNPHMPVLGRRCYLPPSDPREELHARNGSCRLGE